MKQETKKVIFEYIANLIEIDKQKSNFDPGYKSISKEYVLRDIIKKFNLKHSEAYRYCSYHKF